MKKRLVRESGEPMVATIEIPRKKFDVLNDWLENGCDYENAGVDPDSHVYSATATFPDGLEADLNVCSEEEGSNGFWSEICIYNEKGQEVALGEPSYGSLGGEEEFEIDGQTYIVKIAVEGGELMSEDSNKEPVPEFEKLEVRVTEVDWDLSDGAEDDEDRIWDDEEDPDESEYDEREDDLVEELDEQVSKPMHFHWDTLEEYGVLEQDENGKWWLDKFMLDDLVGDTISDMTGYCHNSFDYRWNIER